MRKNRLDMVVDELARRRSLFKGVVQQQFKGTNPYRKEPVSNDERIAQYMQWAGTPMEQQLRQQYGDTEVDMVHQNMQELVRRKSNG